MLFNRDTRVAESFDYVAFDAPGHRANKSFRWRRSKFGADFEQLGHKCRIVRNPIAHDDAATRPGYAGHLTRYVKRPRSKHGAEDGQRQIEGFVLNILQMAGISFLKFQARETLRFRSLVAGLDEIAGDIDSGHVCARPCQRYRRCPIAATEIENLERGTNTEGVNQRFSGLAHETRNFSEVAFLPQCLVRICDGLVHGAAPAD